MLYHISLFITQLVTERYYYYALIHFDTENVVYQKVVVGLNSSVETASDMLQCLDKCQHIRKCDHDLSQL